MKDTIDKILGKTIPQILLETECSPGKLVYAHHLVFEARLGKTEGVLFGSSCIAKE